jgi:hypothetical protein
MRVAYSNVEAVFAQIPLAFLLVLFRSGSSRGIRDTRAGAQIVLATLALDAIGWRDSAVADNHQLLNPR